MEDGREPLVVLCVEDDHVLRMLIELALKLDPAITVHCAGSASDAMRLWTGGLRPDIILVDFLMPGIGGIQLLEQLGAIAGQQLPPTVFLTATSARRDHDLMHGAGAAGIIMKPFDPLTLAQQVRSLLPGPRAG